MTRDDLAKLIDGTRRTLHPSQRARDAAAAILSRYDLVPKGSIVVPAEDRGAIAVELQNNNRHLEITVARYYVDAVCDLLAAKLLEGSELAQSHMADRILSRFDLVGPLTGNR